MRGNYMKLNSIFGFAIAAMSISTQATAMRVPVPRIMDKNYVEELAKYMEEHSEEKELSFWEGEVVDDESERALSDFFAQNKTLKRVIFCGAICAQTSDSIKRIINALSNSTTTYSWHFPSFHMGDERVEDLVNHLITNKNVVILYLLKNGITNKGAIHLARLIEENSTLKSLGLPDNAIGDEGAMALVKASQNLIVLSLKDNPITPECKENIRKFIRDKGWPADKVLLDNGDSMSRESAAMLYAYIK